MKYDKLRMDVHDSFLDSDCGTRNFLLYEGI